MNVRTKIISVPDRASTITGYTIQQFVTLPAAPWEDADSEIEVEFVNGCVRDDDEQLDREACSEPRV